MYIGEYLPKREGGMDTETILKSAFGAIAGGFIVGHVVPKKYHSMGLIAGAITGAMLAHKVASGGMLGLANILTPHEPMIGTSGLGDHAVYPQVQPGNVVTLD